MNHLLIISLILFLSSPATGQALFGDVCDGLWEGRMFIYRHGQLQDSLPVRHEVGKTDTAGVWKWKTDYLSPTQPVSKNYLLRLKDTTRNHYVIDEGQGIHLTAYRHGNKLYSIFETQGYLLTSTYTLQGNTLIFEVTSGRQDLTTGEDIKNYTVDVVQRSIFIKAGAADR